MTLDDIAGQLPWGFHDAFIERVELDYTAANATLFMRFPMTKGQDKDRRGRVELDRLVYWVNDAPTVDPERGYDSHSPAGLWVDLASPENTPACAGLPSCPEGCFASAFYVHTWNSYIHLCAGSAYLVWLEAEPQPARSLLRALRPGNEL